MITGLQDYRMMEDVVFGLRFKVQKGEKVRG
jgi:hypothetical protein